MPVLRSLLVGCVLLLTPECAGASEYGIHTRLSPASAEATALTAVTGTDTLAVRRQNFVRPVAPVFPLERQPPRDSDSDPLDLRIAIRVRESTLHESGIVRTLAGVFRIASVPGTAVLAGALYGVGELTDRDDLSDLGLHSGQAIVVAGGATVAGKVIVGRARPHVSPGEPYDLRFGRGIAGDAYQSFPSAHTAAAFAMASVMAAELGDGEQGEAYWIYPSAYGAASLAGLSRIFDDRHWATDVIAGAVVGALSGWIVLDHHRGAEP